MTEQRDAAIAEQVERAQHHRDQVVACEMAADIIRGRAIYEQSELVKAILVMAAANIDTLHAAHLAAVDSHDARAQVLRAHAQASAKGAPYRPVERLGILTAVRTGRYEDAAR